MRRRKWAKQTNAGFLPKPPGGWSAKGQPCDAFHAYFRLLTDQYEDQCLGYGHNIFRRPRPEDIPVSGCHIRKHLSIQQIIECNIWAWHQMPDAQFRPRHHIAEPCPRTRLARWMSSSWWWGVYINMHGNVPYQPGRSTYIVCNAMLVRSLSAISLYIYDVCFPGGPGTAVASRRPRTSAAGMA